MRKMIKNIILSLMLLISLSSCMKNEKIKEIEKPDDTITYVDTLSYPLDNIKNFVEDETLYTKQRTLSYPANLESNETRPYKKEELSNLDFEKELVYNKLYFSIPSRCKVFKDLDNESRFLINFPDTYSYDISIAFEKITSDKDQKSIDIKEFSKDLAKKKLKDETLLTPISPNRINDIDSFYFLTYKDDYIYTYLLVKTPTGLNLFTIKELKSDRLMSAPIMADLLMSMRIAGNDEIEVVKDFTDYNKILKDPSLKDIKFKGLTLKIRHYYDLIQDKEDLNVYRDMESANLVSEIILKYDEGSSLKEVYDKNSANAIYPLNIVNMGLIEENKSFKYPYMKGKLRVYTNTHTLEGVKIVFKKDDGYISILILTPLINSSISDDMANDLIKSIK